jgi:glycosyltransferase involved in cell wall biosynthesis
VTDASGFRPGDGVAAVRPRVLVTGAFAAPGQPVLGGIMRACTLLAGSGFARCFEVVQHQNEATRLPRPSLPVRALHSLPRARQFTRLLRSERPDAALIFASAGASFIEKGIYVARARSAGVPVLLAMRSGRFMEQCRRSRTFRLLAGRVLHRATAVLCQGESWQRFYGEEFGLPPERCPVIANWIDAPDLFALGRRRMPRRDHPVRVLYMGWLIREKGLFELLAAVRLLHADPAVPRFTLTVAGEGRAGAALREYAANNGLAGVVEFVGLLSEEECARAYAEHDVFVLPSWAEGLPNAMIEAMASGMACVVSRVGAVPDVADDDVHALLVPPRDADALRRSLRALLLDPALRERLGRAAHAMAVERFEIEAAMMRLGTVLNVLIAGGTLQQNRE